jgi:hypothetical protein
MLQLLEPALNIAVARRVPIYLRSAISFQLLHGD